MNCKDFGDKDKRNDTTSKQWGTSNQTQTIPLQDRSQCMNDISINFYIPSKVVDHIISFRNICNHCNTIICIGYQSTYYCNYCDRKICKNCFRVSNISYIHCAQYRLTGCYVCTETKSTQLSSWKYYHCLTCLNDNDNSNENNDY